LRVFWEVEPKEKALTAEGIWVTRLCGAIIETSILDWHRAKRLIYKERVGLDGNEMRANGRPMRDDKREIIFDGLRAHEWLFNEPLPGEIGKYTLQQCCERIGVSVDEVRARAKTREVRSQLMRVQPSE
jgi:hypothetical protein